MSLTALASLYKIVNTAGNQEKYNQREEDTERRDDRLVELLIDGLKSILMFYIYHIVLVYDN